MVVVNFKTKTRAWNGFPRAEVPSFREGPLHAVGRYTVRCLTPSSSNRRARVAAAAPRVPSLARRNQSIMLNLRQLLASGNVRQRFRAASSRPFNRLLKARSDVERVQVRRPSPHGPNDSRIGARRKQRGGASNAQRVRAKVHGIFPLRLHAC